ADGAVGSAGRGLLATVGCAELIAVAHRLFAAQRVGDPVAARDLANCGQGPPLSARKGSSCYERKESEPEEPLRSGPFHLRSFTVNREACCADSTPGSG